MQPKNQHQRALWYLINWNYAFSLKDVIDDCLFYKFQSRLSEIERDCCCFIATRTRVKFTNRFDNKSSYVKYNACIPKEKLIELFNKYD